MVKVKLCKTAPITKLAVSKHLRQQAANHNVQLCYRHTFPLRAGSATYDACSRTGWD